MHYSVMHVAWRTQSRRTLCERGPGSLLNTSWSHCDPHQLLDLVLDMCEDGLHLHVYNVDMASVHEEVLAAAQALARASSKWTFRIADVVRALPHLNRGTVRTHVASRCCVNAPAHHESRHPYFTAVGRGVYRLEPRYRRRPAPEAAAVRPWPDRWFDTHEPGVDTTQIVELLKLVPTERLERMQQFARSLNTLTRAAKRS